MLATLLELKPGHYTSPLEIPYIKKIICSLNLVGAWPYEVINDRKPWYCRNSKMIFIIYTSLIVLCMLYIKKNFNTLNFLDLGKSYISVLMLFVMLHRLVSTWSNFYKDTTKHFFTNVHLIYHKDRSEYAKKVYENVHKISTIFTSVVLIELYVGVNLYNLTPLYNSYKRGMFKSERPANATYDYSVDYDIPLDYKTDFRAFLFLYILNWVFTYDVCIVFVSIDLYLAIVVFNIWGHIKILKYNLRHFPRPQMRGVKCNSVYNPPWYDEDESKQIKALLVDSMKHYGIIRTFMGEVSQAFGPCIYVYFLFQQIVDCIVLTELAQLTPEAFGSYGMMAVNLVHQLIQMSLIFELVATQSETIKDAVYDVPWECMENKNRKIVLIYLCNVQKPMELKAMGMLPVGVRTMASIMKTTLSYFMLLRTSVNR